MSSQPQTNDLYYHFKHITENTENDPYYMIYRIIGIGALATDNKYTKCVIYSSIRDNKIEKDDYQSDYFIRPLEEFLENVNRDGYCGPRFTKIEQKPKPNKN